MNNLPLVTIPATHQHLVKSAAIDQDYLVSVALPYGYEENPDRRYPTIYVMDGHWYFGMVVDMVRIMNTPVPFCNELPDAIIVGVGYPNGSTLIDKRNEIGQRRMRDFSPLKDQGLEEWHWNTFPASKNQHSGGANAFLEFLKGELIPLIESSYRADPSNRCLLGHSLGGLFALHTVYSFPELFQKYVVASPALFEDRSWFQAQDALLPVRMHLSAGELELDDRERADFEQLALSLERKLTGDKPLIKQLFAGNTHCAVVAPAFQAGLVAVLP